MNKNKSLENLRCVSGGVLGISALWGAACSKMRTGAENVETCLIDKLENVGDYIGRKTNKFVYDSFFETEEKSKY